jgi:L-cysteine/cystine lyase
VALTLDISRPATAGEARARYPVLDSIAYLNAGAVGPLARDTHMAMVSALADQLAHGRGAQSAFLALRQRILRLRKLVAGVIGVDDDHLLLTTSTTEGCNIAVQALRIDRGDEVVTTDDEHPGLTAPLETSGAQIRVAPVLEQPADRVLAAILDRVTPRTRLIALSHVGWMDGQVLPIAEVRYATDVPMLVDGAQSAGAIPVDAAAFDFYTVSAQKWLCGPEGTGALYIRDPERWTPGLGSFATTVNQGALRFQLVHHPHTALAGLEAALNLHPEWANARSSDVAVTARNLAQRRFRVIQAGIPGPMFSIAVSGDTRHRVAHLEEVGVIVRSIPGTPWLRVSCGYWTNEDDIERLLAALEGA